MGLFPTWTQHFCDAFHPASRTKDQTHAFPCPPSVRPASEALWLFQTAKAFLHQRSRHRARRVFGSFACFCACGADLSTPGTKDWHQAAPRRAAVMTWPFDSVWLSLLSQGSEPAGPCALRQCHRCVRASGGEKVKPCFEEIHQQKAQNLRLILNLPQSRIWNLVSQQCAGN